MVKKDLAGENYKLKLFPYVAQFTQLMLRAFPLTSFTAINFKLSGKDSIRQKKKTKKTPLSSYYIYQ